MKIGIVGAGLTGLIAAKVLAEHGVHAEIFEKMNIAGGRMRTETIDNWSLDVGFQVLLTAYPQLQKHIDFSELDLHYLDAGATIFRNGKKTSVGDPFRTKHLLFATLFSDVGSLKDKWLIFKLKRKTDQLSIEEIFRLPNEPSSVFLKKFGFSDRIISRFFQPFYSGIFLEDQLETSSRMLLFIFKMFAEGKAAIPSGGIGKVAEQLIYKSKVNIHYNCEVSKVDHGQIHCENGNSHVFDWVIDTTPIHHSKQPENSWHGCHNFYFEHSSPRIMASPRIGLNAHPNRWINNIFYLSSLNQPKPGKELLSITIVNDQGIKGKALQKKVEYELAHHFGITNGTFLKHYFIPFALPKMHIPNMTTDLKIENQTIFAGDYLLNGSQNAACKLGEEAAKLILAKNGIS